MEAYGEDANGVDQAFIIEDASPTTPLHGASLAQTGATLFQGSVSVINILLGIGILSMPFAMRSAGAAGVLSVVFCCFLFCTTGKFIHWGLDLIPANVPRDYPSLGEAAVGPIGRTLVSIAAALELSGGTCMTLIILWRSIEQLLTHGLNGTGVSAEWIHVAAVALGIAIQLPLCVYGNFRTISGFSFTGCLTTAAVMLLILFLPVLDPHKQHLNEDPSHHALSISIVPATSIFALGVAGHAAFPSVRASMASKPQFATALNIAYAACALATGVVCAVGYWYWGDSAHVLVTTDFEAHSPYAAFTLRGWGIQSAVEVLIALNVGTTAPLFVFAMTDIFLACCDAEVQVGSRAVRQPSLRVMRAAVTVTSIVVAYAVQDVLIVVESVAGAVAIIFSSLFLPTIFYIALRRKKGLLRPRDWAAGSCMLLFGLVLMAVVLFQTGCKLFHWLRGDVDGHSSPSDLSAAQALAEPIAELGSGWDGLLRPVQP